MTTLKKTILWIGGISISALCFSIGYVQLALPNVGKAPQMTIERTPERIARGKYLANHITLCMDCHSKRDWTRFSGPPVAGTTGMGGERFDQTLGFPGVYYSANITPKGISRYTDGELFRIITTGVTKEGRAIFPVMPYHYYGRMDEEDIKDIIAYLRSLPPIDNNVPSSKSDFPMNILINTIPQKASLNTAPPQSDVVHYGQYLVNAGACMECHTKFEKGSPLKGTEFGGGREFAFPNGDIVRSSNITPDKETGIGSWTEDVFINTFHARSDSSILSVVLKPGDFNTIMPWTMYGKMHNQDLHAIFTYLRTIKPIKNAVNVFSVAKQKIK
ncbi:MAG: cytochrome C [Bacteroidetes bacterium]|nr:cytochrome C [Bacteroidota bacterium]